MNLSSMISFSFTQSPLLLVCLVGIVWSLTQIDRDQRAALLVLAGLGTFLLASIAQIVLQQPIQQLLSQALTQPSGSPYFWLSYSVPSFAFNVVRAFGLGLVTMAAFVDRAVMATIISAQPVRP